MDDFLYLNYFGGRDEAKTSTDWFFAFSVSTVFG